MPIATTQDIVKGVDFTALSPQTASEHNQLVEQATPYEVDSNNGVAFILTTTDTAAGVPDVPNPLTSSGYNKWKRYLWNRRGYSTDSPQIPRLYQWSDDVSSDPTYRKWVLLDPASFTSVGGGLGTALQTAIDTINTTASNADAAATAASAAVTSLAADVGTVTGDDLQTQVTAVTNEAAQATSDIEDGQVWAGGASDTPAWTNTGGVNGKLADMQKQVTDGLTAASSVANLTPSSTPGAMIRTNDDASAVEWFNPADTANNIVSFTSSGTLPPGVWLIMANMGGNFYFASGGTGNVYFTVTVGSIGTITSVVAQATAGSGVAFPLSLTALGIITIPKASGSQAVSLSKTPTVGTVPTAAYKTVCYKLAVAP